MEKEVAIAERRPNFAWRRPSCASAGAHPAAAAGGPGGRALGLPGGAGGGAAPPRGAGGAGGAFPGHRPGGGALGGHPRAHSTQQEGGAPEAGGRRWRPAPPPSPTRPPGPRSLAAAWPRCTRGRSERRDGLPHLPAARCARTPGRWSRLDLAAGLAEAAGLPTSTRRSWPSAPTAPARPRSGPDYRRRLARQHMRPGATPARPPRSGRSAGPGAGRPRGAAGAHRESTGPERRRPAGAGAAAEAAWRRSRPAGWRSCGDLAQVQEERLKDASGSMSTLRRRAGAGRQCTARR